MKKFLAIALSILMTVPAFSKPFDQMSKEEQSDYEILVVKKSTGQVVGRMNRSTHKVVSLESVEQVKEEFRKQVIREEEAKTTYSAILTGGVGKDGVTESYKGSGTYQVSEKTVPVGQLTLCGTRNRLGLCASASTNEFYGLGFKFDWK